LAVIGSDVYEISVKGAEKAAREFMAVSHAQESGVVTSDRLAIALEGVEKALTQTGTQTKNAKRGLSKVQAGMVTLEASVSLARMSIGAFNVVLKGISEPVNLAVQFETQFNQIKTLTDKAGDQLEADLLALAGRLPQTAGDITKATYNAISAGIDPSQVVDFVEAAAQAAVAGGGTLTESVDAIRIAVNAYKAEGLTAAKASDILFSTVRQGVTTFPELASQLGQLLPLTSQFGVSIEESTAAIAALTRSGVSTSESVTQLSSLLTSIVSPSKKTKDSFEALGVEYGAAAIEARGLSGVIAQLTEKTGGSTQAFADMFDRKESIKAALTLGVGAADSFAEAITAAGNASGETARAFGIMSQGTQGTINRFNALKEQVLRDLGTNLLPLVNDMLGRIGKFLSEHGQEFVTTITKMVEGVVKFGQWVFEHGETIIKVFGGLFIAEKVASFATAVGVLTTSLKALGTTAATTGGAVTGMGASILSVLGPVGIVAGAAAIAYELGGAIGESIGEGMTESLRAEMAALEVTVKNQMAALQADIKQRGFKSIKELEARRSQVTGGKALVFGAGQRVGATGAIGGGFAKDATVNFGEALEQFGLAGTEALVADQLAAFEKASANLGLRSEQNLTQAKIAQDRFFESQAELAELGMTDLGRLKRDAGRGAEIEREQSALRAEIASLEGQALTDQAKAAEIERGRRALTLSLESARADALKKGQAPEVLSSQERPEVLRKAAEAARKDATKRGRGASARAAKDTQRAEKILSDARIALIDSETERAIARLQVRTDAQIAIVQKAGGDTSAILELQAKREQEIFEAGGVRQRAAMKARFEALDEERGIARARFEEGVTGMLEGIAESDAVAQFSEGFDHMRETLLALEEQTRQSAEAFKAFGAAAAHSLGVAIVNAVLFGDSFKNSVNLLATALTAKAGLKVLEETAEGFSSLANPLTAPLAPGHFLAAAKWLAVGAAAGAVAGATGGLNRGGASAGGSGGGGSAAPRAPRLTDSEGEKESITQVILLGDVYSTDQMAKEALAARTARGSAGLGQRRGAPRFDPRSFRRRR